MNFVFILCFLFHPFFSHAETAEDATSKNTLQHAKISDIRKKLIYSEKVYTKLTKHVRHWPQFTCLNTAFKRGDKDPAIGVIKKQLTLLKIIRNQLTTDTDSDLFDQALETGIKAFQRRHSLESDGIIGHQTCIQLNIAPQVRVKSIQHAIMQFDNLKSQWGNRYILVNLPTFTLFAVHNDQIEITQPVIVGSKNRQTPISTYPVQSIVLNPTWRVPISIFVKDKLSKVLADPTYLERGNYLVYDSNGELLDSNKIDWEDVSLTYFPYKVRQQPGKKNALGTVKFNLQNDQQIYMHGTPETSLFKKGFRALSSGCIRVSDPISLALWVLNSENISKEQLQEKIDSEETVTLSIKTPVTVFTTNIPVWINENDVVQFGIESK